MKMTGNVFLGLATLLFILIFSFTYFKAAPRNDLDKSVFLLALLSFNLLFLICMVFAVFAIAANGGFDWIAPNKTLRYLLVGGGLLSAKSFFGSGCGSGTLL